MSGRALLVAALLLGLGTLASAQTNSACTSGVSVHNVCLGTTTLLVLKIAAGLQIVSFLCAAFPRLTRLSNRRSAST